MVSVGVITFKFDNLQKKQQKKKNMRLRRYNATARFEPTEAGPVIIYNTESQYFAFHSPE